MDKKMLSPHTEWCIGKCPGLCTLFLKTSTWYLKFMLYHAVFLDCLGYLRFFLNCSLGALSSSSSSRSSSSSSSS